MSTCKSTIFSNVLCESFVLFSNPPALVLVHISYNLPMKITYYLQNKFVCVIFIMHNIGLFIPWLVAYPVFLLVINSSTPCSSTELKTWLTGNILTPVAIAILLTNLDEDDDWAMKQCDFTFTLGLLLVLFTAMPVLLVDFHISLSMLSNKSTF